MANRYTIHKSNYLLRTRHQETKLGTITERDWPTVNGLNVLRFGPGRRIWYNSGNFVFTTSNIPTYHKKHRLTTQIDQWQWDDCKDADGTVNEIKPNFFINDIRNFAYYGSCVELIRATIEEIIMDFPGRIVSSKSKLEEYDIDGYVLSNDFNIDLHHKLVTLGKYDNELRFMSNSWSKYCIKTDSGIENVESFTIGEWLGDLECPQKDEGKNVINITFSTEGNTYTIKGYSIGKSIVYVYENDTFISIQPQQEYIDEYFSSLKGLKAQLLRQDTKPLYMNKFRTPIEYNFEWYYPERLYIWPSNDYCIDIGSMAFAKYMENLIDMGQKFDELWSDNIYRSMTHESIKNFDWTYTRDYYKGEEQNNIEGGERMMKILRVFGRAFDDLKYYMDSIKNMNRITYDNTSNCPQALLSDKVELEGLDVVTTIGSDYDINETLDEEFLTNNVTKDISWLGQNAISTHKLWYQTRNCEDIYPDVCDNEIMRRFVLSVKRLMQSKGTHHAIDMLMGFFGFGRDPFSPSDKDDYTITEEAYYTTKLIPYDECVNEGERWDNVVGIDWNKIINNTKGDVITEINNLKNIDRIYYDDPYSGIPLRIIYTGHDNKPFVVPYYDGQLVYDGNLVFQENGGWEKNEGGEDFEYQETLSYLHVVNNISELMKINPYMVQNNDIYYVANINDYLKYDENPPIVDGEMILSRYFVLINEYEPNKFSSWKNIVIKPNEDCILEKVEEEIFNSKFIDGEDVDWEYNSYEYHFKHMVYLENIISTNVGNNPHVGYGNYDNGQSFLEYMKNPFKYSLDNYLFDDLTYATIAKQVKFDDITQDNKVMDKIQIMGNTKDENNEEVSHYNENNILNEESNVWYINTKVITITNNIKDNDLYKKYFKEVILPYLTQVIPSTTILKLKGF